MKCGHTLPVFGRVPREGLARLWRTTLLARSSELYLPAHGWRERWMRLMGSQLSCQPGRRIPRAAASGMLRPMKSGERSDRSQIVPRTVRREVYKALVPPQRSRVPDPFRAKIVFHKQLACCAFQIFLAHSGKIKVPRRSSLTAFLPVRIIVAIDRKSFLTGRQVEQREKNPL